MQESSDTFYIAMGRGQTSITGQLRILTPETDKVVQTSIQSPGRYVVDSAGLRPPTPEELALFESAEPDTGSVDTEDQSTEEGTDPLDTGTDTETDADTSCGKDNQPRCANGRCDDGFVYRSGLCHSA